MDPTEGKLGPIRDYWEFWQVVKKTWARVAGVSKKGRVSYVLSGDDRERFEERCRADREVGGWGLGREPNESTRFTGLLKSL